MRYSLQFSSGTNGYLAKNKQKTKVNKLTKNEKVIATSSICILNGGKTIPGRDSEVNDWWNN
ncbi:hypothetical protein KKA14_09255 [bacterium]|nr:hypothetical protein [bacterium]